MVEISSYRQIMDNFEDLPIDDDPYCLDDEPKVLRQDKTQLEVTIVNIDFKTIEDEIGKT